MVKPLQIGPSSWRVQIRRKGLQPITETFRTERLAQKFIDRIENAIEDGKPITTTSAPTVRSLVATFRELRESGARPIKEGSTEFYMLRHLEEGMGDWPADAVSPQRLVTWARTRLDEGAGPATIGMEVSKLGTVFRHAGTWLRTALPDPVTPARSLLEYNGLIGPSDHRTRRPSKEELGAIFQRADPMMADLIRAAIGTCLRRGELARVLWRDLDHVRKVLTVRDRKHPRKTQGNHHTIPLLLDAYDIIARQPKVDDRIFPVSPEWVSDTFKSLCDDCGITDLHFHDLRHEGISRLFEAGYAIEQVAMVSGHKRWEHLKRYTNLRPEQLSALPAPAAGRGTRKRRGGQQSAAPGPGRSESRSAPR